ncbi:rhamnogalacturonan acetylesterase [Sphingobacterium corticibacterium]|uniref:Rhamnogalacturonan acetylesterase n=1 Tax=Sphingobacterium corticibacterium TaxID=2484746 RepID=A0A4Q6XVF2_9SPHI|nr:rhamnogalacturonan acetylesterase [Sphingobacterium corticibacterium]RZF60386.1 rhamnogalacturonan acetylesterase [Sphingobacterium corticibacterium]
MNKYNLAIVTLVLGIILTSFSYQKVTTIYLIGDSTVANYALEDDYDNKRYPLVGWGQVFQPFFVTDSLKLVEHLLGKVEHVKIDDRAKGGRSTRTFFQEGRWSAIYKTLQKGDVVMMQFGHNDGAENYPERYVNIDGYKEFLRLFINQTRERGALPILLTPVARNYPWKEGKLHNVHGAYPQAVKDVAIEMDVKLIDLNELSMTHFSAKGQDYVTKNYFMNFPAGQFRAYPDGQQDNTHFQVAGGKAIAQLVFDAMKGL